MKINVKRSGGNMLVTCSEADEEKLSSLPIGQELNCEIKRIRNVEFHKKWMSLVRLAYNYFEPYGVEGAQKNFDTFRGDVIKLAGYYDTVYFANGGIVLKPKSISFSNMEQSEFESLYSKTLDVVVSLLQKYGVDDVDSVIHKALEYEL